jgi:hypothetical protein
MIDFLEQQLTSEVHNELLEHMKQCTACAREYRELQELHEIMGRDAVTLPSEQTFEGMKVAARQQALHQRRGVLKQLTRVLLPAFAVAAILLFVLRPRVDTLEMSIPVANLLEDREVAEIAVAGIVNKDILDEIEGLEEQLFLSTEEAIEEMSKEEKREFVTALYQKYAIGT